jgi:hypothetical protein
MDFCTFTRSVDSLPGGCVVTCWKREIVSQKCGISYESILDLDTDKITVEYDNTLITR